MVSREVRVGNTTSRMRPNHRGQPAAVVRTRSGVRRPSRSVRGIPLSNLIAVHASVFRHGPSRSPAGLIIPTVGRDRTIAIDKQVTTVSRTGWTNEKA